MDWFKHTNDNFGHERGDQVLREAAQILLDTLTDQAIVSRYGGEEFLISTADKALYKAKDRGRNQVVSANDLLAEGSIPKSRT
ncbi:PleD family two-component response regulator [Psychrobacter sp. PL15]|nr:PleD family two-component response regulator [Psychrobacter sp. PL15]